VVEEVKILIIIRHSIRFWISGGSSGGIHYHGGTRGSCKGSNCLSSTVIWLSILGGIAAFALLTVGIYYCVKHWRGRPSQSNAVFIKKETTENCEPDKFDISMFKSGDWKSRYFQYGKWHGPHKFSLSFDSKLKTVTGSGSDDIGKFTINGFYSTETSRVGLTKKYQIGTGNRLENLGHQVTIQLAWNAQNDQFEGKWYVQTSKYHGEDKFELKFDGQHILSVYEKV